MTEIILLTLPIAAIALPFAAGYFIAKWVCSTKATTMSQKDINTLLKAAKILKNNVGEDWSENLLNLIKEIKQTKPQKQKTWTK